MKDLPTLLRNFLNQYDEEERMEMRSRFYRLLEDKYDLKHLDILSGLKSLSANDLISFEKDLKRLSSGEVLQYIIGWQNFCGMQIKVNKAVLVPRPETEELVDIAFREAKAIDKAIDLGTGSGCIALALKNRFKKVYALEKSQEALELAQENTRNLNRSIEFIWDDMLNPIEEWPGDLDLIVSNPPYVKQGEARAMEAAVKYGEPQMALFVEDDDPLLFYRAIKEYALKALNSNGVLIVEINQYLGEETKSLFAEAFENTRLLQDQFGNDRFVVAKK